MSKPQKTIFKKYKIYTSPESVQKTNIKGGKKSDSALKIVTRNRYLLFETSNGSSGIAVSDSNVVLFSQQDDNENEVKKILAPSCIFVQGGTNQKGI